MVTIDYQLIIEWMRKSHITRKALCEATKIPDGTLAAAFKRKSKMQIAYVWRIADFMNMPPEWLLKRDEHGLRNGDDVQRVRFGRTEYEIEIENEKIADIVKMLKTFNAGGLEEVCKMIGLLWEIPRFRKEVNELYDGSPDYWEKHPYESQVTPSNESEDMNIHG